MTEAEWFDPGTEKLKMFHHLHFGRPQPVITPRKRRLLVCACCRRLAPLLPPAALDALAVAERVADGELGRRDLPGLPDDGPGRWVWGAVEGRLCGRYLRAAMSGLLDVIETHPMDPVLRERVGTIDREREVQRALIHDLFGNPFRPVAFDPGWNTGTVLALARGMYDGRDFGGMPILADALQEAGCEEPSVLGHCRGEGPHVRGCWVVDGILGRK